MTLVALAVAATLADLATFVLLIDAHGVAAEANPVVRELAAAGLAGPVGLKALLVVVLVAWQRAVRRFARPVLLAALVVGSIGAFSNVAVLVA